MRLRLLGVVVLLGAALVAAKVPRVPRRDALALLGITAVAAVLRVLFLDLDARYDEAYTFLTFASRPLAAGAGTYPLPNNHLLHTVLMHDAWRLFGDALPALRLPAFLAGLAIVPAMYAAGRALVSREVGLLAAALAAGAPPLVEFSVNGRGYTLTWLAFALLVALSTRRDRAAWALWAVVAALGLYAIPTMAYAVATVALATLLVAPARWRELGAALAGAAALALVLYADVLDEPGWSFDPANRPGAGELIGDVVAYAHHGLGPIALVFAALAVVGLVGPARPRRDAASGPPTPSPLPALALAALVVVLLVALAPGTPPFVRSWMYLVPVELLLVAAGAAALVRRHTAPLAVAVSAALALVVAIGTPPYNDEDAPVRGAARLAAWAKQQPAGTRIRFHPGSLPSLQLHFRRAGTPLEVLAAEAPLVAVSRTRGETPPRGLRRVERFDELELYAAR